VGSIVTTPPAFNTRSQKTQCPPEASDTAGPTYDHDGNLIDTPHRRGNNKPKEKFKGTIKKLHGYVFQLYEESQKHNQFTLSLEALHSYASIEFENQVDLTSFFAEPISEPLIDVPNDLPLL
jgi:hypothetical protein